MKPNLSKIHDSNLTFETLEIGKLYNYSFVDRDIKTFEVLLLDKRSIKDKKYPVLWEMLDFLKIGECKKFTILAEWLGDNAYLTKIENIDETG